MGSQTLNPAIVTARNALAVRLEERHASGMSWRAIAEEFEISKPMAYRIAKNGYMPKSRAIRRRLGLVAPSRPRRDWRGSFAWLASLWVSGALDRAPENPVRVSSPSGKLAVR